MFDTLVIYYLSPISVILMFFQICMKYNEKTLKLDGPKSEINARSPGQ
jgi:hypothetical protein